MVRHLLARRFIFFKPIDFWQYLSISNKFHLFQTLSFYLDKLLCKGIQNILNQISKYLPVEFLSKSLSKKLFNRMKNKVKITVHHFNKELLSFLLIQNIITANEGIELQFQAYLYRNTQWLFLYAELHTDLLLEQARYL